MTMTANVTRTVEYSQALYETYVAYRLVLIHFTCSSSLQSGV